MAEETPDPTPQPPKPPTLKPPVAGVRPITIKPVIPPKVQPPAQEEAQKTDSQAPAPPAPATIRLKPVTKRADSSTDPAPVPSPGSADATPTVRVRPMITARPPLTTASTPAGTPQPGGSPLPPGPKPLKPEQIHAAKSKTSRISLDAALVGGQEERGGPKTIRLKRPTDAPVGKITSHLGAAAAAATGQSPSTSALIPPISKEPSAPVVNRFTQSIDVQNADLVVRRQSATAALSSAEGEAGKSASGSTSVVPPDPSATEDPSITRRKTIRVKRSGGASSSPTFKTPASRQVASASEGSEEGEEFGEVTITETPPVVTVEKTHWFFPLVAVAALFVIIALLVVQVAQDRDLADLTAWPPNVPTIRLPGMAPIPGRG